MRPILVHINRVETALKGLKTPQSFTFAAACAQRVWPVYKKASDGKPWENQKLLRSSLDEVWDWLGGLSERPAGLASRCEMAVFEDDQNELEDSAAFYAANTLFSLMSIVENDQPQHVYQVAQSNLDILDAFLYDHLSLSVVSSDSDMIVDEHILMIEEMDRQIEDLHLLRQPLTLNVVSQVRNRSEGISILDDLWYTTG